MCATRSPGNKDVDMIWRISRPSGQLFHIRRSVGSYLYPDLILLRSDAISLIKMACLKNVSWTSYTKCVYKLFTYQRCFLMTIFVYALVFPTANFRLVPYTALLSLPPSPSYFQVLENYNKGKTALLSAAKIMVSPTEVDLNAETYFHGVSNSHEPTPQTQHRRNSSVRWALLVHLQACTLERIPQSNRISFFIIIIRLWTIKVSYN